MPTSPIQTPIINGDQVTFIWYGEQRPELIGDFNYWSMERSPIPLELVSQDKWQVTLTLPTDSYIEYGFVVDGQRIPDPLNPNVSSDGLGSTNSYFWMPAAIDTDLAQVIPVKPSGQLTSYTVEGRGYGIDPVRSVHLYQPAFEGKTPLLVVLDGQGYIEHAKLPSIVDNLIAQQKIQPISMAFIDSGGHGRIVEYACSDATIAFLIYCLLPLARKRLNLLDTHEVPGAFGLMGASMGGLMSLYAALRVPETFGNVLSQSGAFAGEHLYYSSVIHDLIEYLPPRSIRIWMDAGQHEWYLSSNRKTAQSLTNRGYDVHYHEHTSGHNFPSWRNQVARGLEFLFPHRTPITA